MTGTSGYRFEYHLHHIKIPSHDRETIYSTWLAAILRFRAKSEGLGDFSLLNNETTRTLTSSPGTWESSGSLPELSTAAGSLLLLVLGPLSLLLLGPAATTPFDEHYTCIIPVKLSDYS